jgi:hypothetical protein
VIEYPEGTFYLHKTQILCRNEPLPLKVVDYHGKSGMEEFDKSVSVFKEFIEDTRNKASDCLDHDLRCIEWSLISKHDIIEVREFIQDNYD